MRWRRVDNPDVIDAPRALGGGGLRIGGGLGVVGVVLFLADPAAGRGRGRHRVRHPERLRRRACRPGRAAGSRRARIPSATSRTSAPTSSPTRSSSGSRRSARRGERYERAKLVLFRSGVSTACGSAVLGGRAVLLPGRPARLPRPLLRARARGARCAPAATSPGPTSSPTRWATTSSSSSARTTGSSGCAARTRATRTSCRSAPSCRPTATPASGRTAVYKERRPRVRRRRRGA